MQTSQQIIGLKNLTILDYWEWAYSDILSNTNRSIFAEFLVASALNLLHNPRLEWDAVDLKYGNKKIEVKASAYLQSWFQNKHSVIRFDIGKKKSWDALTNTCINEPTRSADCYIFCLYLEKEKDKAKNNIIDINKWEFYVVSTEKINEVFKNQKTTGLKQIQALCNPVKYSLLKESIEQV
jgi:hypothetical protein